LAEPEPESRGGTRVQITQPRKPTRNNSFDFLIVLVDSDRRSLLLILQHGGGPKLLVRGTFINTILDALLFLINSRN
jgi:hypothetical protein